MLQIEEAIQILTEAVPAVRETQICPAGDACGRILAEDVAAQSDQPPFPRSPLDGYALRAADLADASREHPAVLEVVGKIYAGELYTGEVGPGQALRLMTGAPIPAGADAVIRQEDTKASAKMVEVYASLRPYQNYCYAGEDYQKGEILLKKGMRLNAGALCVLSSLGKTQVCVYRRPRVSVFTTGDEVILPGEPMQPGKIYDSNLAYIRARLEELGFAPVRAAHAADSAGDMAETLKRAAQDSDLIITTGGVSVGEKDILHEVEELLGARHLFWNVNIKPGRPTLAFLCEGTPVLCLSGNPFGAIVNFELLARPMLAALTGDESLKMKPETALLSNEYKKRGGKRRFLRGRLSEGRVHVCDRPAGAVSSMAQADCLVEIRPECSMLPAGSPVTVYRI